jgi:hypothetical protein
LLPRWGVWLRLPHSQGSALHLNFSKSRTTLLSFRDLFRTFVAFFRNFNDEKDGGDNIDRHGFACHGRGGRGRSVFRVYSSEIMKSPPRFSTPM